MSGALGYRVLTSGGALAAISLLVLDLGVVAGSRHAWQGDGLWAMQQLGSSLVIGLPLILVLITLAPLLRGGARADESLLPVSTIRSRLLRTAVDLLPVAGVHLTFVLGAVGYALANGDQIVWASALLSLLMQLLAILWVGILARAIGELSRHPAGVLAGGAVGVLLAAYGANALRVSAGNSPYAGLAVEPSGYVMSSVVLLFTAALVILRPRGGRAGASVAMAGLVTVLVAGQSLGEPALRPSGATPSDCEAVEGVFVCVFPGYAFMKADLVDSTRASLVALRVAGVDAHLDRVEQSVPGHVEMPGTAAVSFDPISLSLEQLNPAMVRGSLLHPTWCPRINSPERLPARFDMTQQLAFHWLEHLEGATSDHDFQTVVPDFARLPEKRQRAMVQEFFDRNLKCEGLG